MGEFLEMGGYAAFIWPAYGLTFGMLALLAWFSMQGLKDTQNMFNRLSAAAENDERKSDK